MSVRPFKPLSRTTVADQIRDEILARIASGELPPGSQMPAERVLTQEFEVARTSVREAIQALVAIGVVERRGNRTYIAQRLADTELTPSSGRLKTIRDLVAARRLLERLLFDLATNRATARERQRVLELAREPAPATLEELIHVDRQFHATVAGACGNPVLTEVYGRVVEALMTENLSPEILVGCVDAIDEQEAITRVASEHLAIAQAFMAADSDTIIDIVAHHVGPVEGWVSRTSMGGPRRTAMAQEAGLDRTVGM